MIAIIDYGMGNINSIYQKLLRFTNEVMVTNKADEIGNADKIILPGVGHFAKGMSNIKTLGLIEVLNHKVLIEKVPVFGICLGMQLMTDYSEEGDKIGLGWINAKTKLFHFDNKSDYLPVPNVGWRKIIINDLGKEFFEDFDSDDMFYFSHSYYIDCNDENDVIATSKYGFDYPAAIHKNNIFGTQFHPEKSHLKGFNLLKKFALE